MLDFFGCLGGHIPCWDKAHAQSVLSSVFPAIVIVNYEIFQLLLASIGDIFDVNCAIRTHFTVYICI